MININKILLCLSPIVLFMIIAIYSKNNYSIPQIDSIIYPIWEPNINDQLSKIEHYYNIAKNNYWAWFYIIALVSVSISVFVGRDSNNICVLSSIVLFIIIIFEVYFAYYLAPITTTVPFSRFDGSITKIIRVFAITYTINIIYIIVCNYFNNKYITNILNCMFIMLAIISLYLNHIYLHNFPRSGLYSSKYLTDHTFYNQYDGSICSNVPTMYGSTAVALTTTSVYYTMPLSWRLSNNEKYMRRRHENNCTSIAQTNCIPIVCQ